MDALDVAKGNWPEDPFFLGGGTSLMSFFVESVASVVPKPEFMRQMRTVLDHARRLSRSRKRGICGVTPTQNCYDSEVESLGSWSSPWWNLDDVNSNRRASQDADEEFDAIERTGMS